MWLASVKASATVKFGLFTANFNTSVAKRARVWQLRSEMWYEISRSKTKNNDNMIRITYPFQQDKFRNVQETDLSEIRLACPSWTLKVVSQDSKDITEMGRDIRHLNDFSIYHT